MSGLLNSWLWWADRVCCRVARQPLHGVVHTACRWLPAMLYPFIFGPEAVQGTKMVEQVKRIGVPDIRAHKGGVPIVSLTAYTTPVARAFDAHVDLILVGDSVGMVLYGMSTTLPVTLEMMIAHGQAVMRGSRRACVMVDLPFGSYQESKEQAFRSASRVLVETGCAAVKLEGGVEMAETIRFLVQRGVPVCGHIGLMPQSVQVAGGFRATGRSADEAEKLRADARAVDEAGAFAVVLEGVVEPLAAAITADVSLPTIGIGASPQCDGQVLVADDVLGVFDDFTPRFAKRYAELGALMGPAAAAYAEEVRARRFPSLQHCFGVRKASVADASIKPVQTS